MSEKTAKEGRAEEKKELVRPQWLDVTAENGADQGIETSKLSGLYVFPESDETWVLILESAGGMKVTVGGMTIEQANYARWIVKRHASLPEFANGPDGDVSGLGKTLTINDVVAHAKDKFPRPMIQLVDPQG